MFDTSSSGKQAKARAERQLTDLDDVDAAAADRLSAAGLGSMEALAKATPKQIQEASGLEGMQAIIVKEQASRTVEARGERSLGGRVQQLISSASPRLQQQARMWVTNRLGRLLRGGR